jgi:AraC-like DNA-binding protein
MSSAESKPGISRYSTDSIPPKDRVAFIREALGPAHRRTEIEPMGDEPFRMAGEYHSWASASLHFCEVTPMRTSCDKNGDGDFFRLVRVEGTRDQHVPGGISYEFSRGVSYEMDRPDVISMPNEMPIVSRYLRPCRHTVLRIPRKSLAYAFRNVEAMPVRRIDRSSPPLRLLMGYIALLRREGPAGDPAVAHQVAQHLTDLAALALDPTRERLEQSAPGVRQARLATVRADVLANISQPDLSAQIIARRHGVSDRYIRLLFEEAGQTFSGFVLEERLKRAFQLLNAPARAGMRISDIAAEAGFSEVTAFNRAFRRRFGVTPSDVRAQARRSGDPSGD